MHNDFPSALSQAQRMAEELGRRYQSAVLPAVKALETHGAAIADLVTSMDRAMWPLAERFREIQLNVGEVALLFAQAARQAVEAQRRTLIELRRYAEALEKDSSEPFRAAGVFLRQAADDFEAAAESGDDYRYAFATRLSVSAVEEVARQLVGNSSLNLRQALATLARQESIAQQDREWLEELNDLRNTHAGLGHGAGGCPEYVASFAFSAVLRGLRALIPSSPLPGSLGVSRVDSAE